MPSKEELKLSDDLYSFLMYFILYFLIERKNYMKVKKNYNIEKMF